jgi:hypothetical protein
LKYQVVLEVVIAVEASGLEQAIARIQPVKDQVQGADCPSSPGKPFVRRVEVKR